MDMRYHRDNPFNRFDRQRDAFDRSFNRMNRVFWFVFSAIAVIIVAMMLAYGTLAYMAYQDGLDGIARRVGEFGRNVEEGYRQGK